MADHIIRKGQTFRLTLNASGDSDVLLFPDADLTGIMFTTHGTFSATAVAVKATLDPSLKNALTDAGWKTINSDVSGGAAEMTEPWAAMHFDTNTYASGALVVLVKPY